MKISNRIITIDRTPVFFGNDSLSCIDRFLRSVQKYNNSVINPAIEIDTAGSHNEAFILVDPESRKYCLPILLGHSASLAKARILETEGGEDSKSLTTAEKLWHELLASGADRNSLLVNLGGGVVSDLGGFVAAGYKRGINYINIPTTLMGQADAAIGGKTAVNLGHIKNQIGFFHSAKAVFIFPGFLKTLPEEHLRSGLAEIIKSALISDAEIWHRLLRNPVGKLLNMPVESGLWINLIAGAVKFKNRVVENDYRERKLRKVLNFGHTVGHALEAFSRLGTSKPLLHGEAVAAGMICASCLSHRKTGLSLTELNEIKAYLTEGFPAYPVDGLARSAIMELIMHDKKNQNGRIQFALISKPGHPVINVSCSQEEIFEALEFLNSEK